MEITPRNSNINIKPINYFKNLKGYFSIRNNNNNNIAKNILSKDKNNKYFILNKNKNLNRFLQKMKVHEKKKDNKEGFRLLALSRKMKYG